MQRSELFLQLFRMPHVIAVQESHKLPSRCTYPSISGGVPTSVDVVPQVAQAAIFEAVDSKCCIVAGGIIHYDQFELTVSLSESAFETAANTAASVKRWNNDAYGWGMSHCRLRVVAAAWTNIERLL
jgi:hypothetical protein